MATPNQKIDYTAHGLSIASKVMEKIQEKHVPERRYQAQQLFNGTEALPYAQYDACKQ